MPNYSDYDMMDAYDFDQFVTPSMLQDSLIAAGAGAGAILLASWISPFLPAPEKWKEDPEKMVNMSRLRAALAGVGGLLVGRLMWDWNRDAAMAVIGGVTGLAAAQIVDSFIQVEDESGTKKRSTLIGTPLGVLPEDVELSAADEALLSAYDAPGAMAALETTGITSAPGAFADPTVTPEPLFGLDGTVVQQETLGAYNPYLS